MQLADIDNSLPNGFHDAFLESVHVDYIRRRALIKLRLWVGDLDAATESQREAYKSAELELLDLVYLVIEAPNPRYKFAEARELCIDGGEAKAESAPACPIPSEALPSGAFAYWFFIDDWNSFFHIAAMDANLRWCGDSA